jgi:hypothetical protein
VIYCLSTDSYVIIKKEGFRQNARKPPAILFRAVYFLSIGGLVPCAFLVPFLVSLGGVGGIPGLSIILLTSCVRGKIVVRSISAEAQRCLRS